MSAFLHGFPNDFESSFESLASVNGATKIKSNAIKCTTSCALWCFSPSKTDY